VAARIRVPRQPTAVEHAPAPGVTEWSGELRKSGQVTLDASGNGTITVASDNAWQRWVVESVWVSTNQAQTATPVPTAELFVGPASSRANSRGVSWSGNQDTFEGRILVGRVDEFHIVFAGGIPGTVASAVIGGTKHTRRS
jgi:hypothetical protein